MTRRRRYASDAEGKRLAKLAGDMGVRDVAGIDFYPDGRVRVLDRAAVSASSAPGGYEDDAEKALSEWEGGAGASGRA